MHQIHIGRTPPPIADSISPIAHSGASWTGPGA